MPKYVWQNRKRLTSDLSLEHYAPKTKIWEASNATDYEVRALILHKFDGSKMKVFAHAPGSLHRKRKIAAG